MQQPGPGRFEILEEICWNAPPPSPEPLQPLPLPVEPKKRLPADRLARRRQQCRESQKRYRLKRKDYERDLEQSIKILRSEVERLRLERHSKQTTLPPTLEEEEKDQDHELMVVAPVLPPNTRQDALKLAMEYVQCFRCGFDANRASPGRTTVQVDPSIYQNLPPGAEQILFLQSFMYEDLRYGELCGQEKLLEQWRRYTSYFDGLQLYPHSFDILPQRGRTVGKALTKLRVTITPATFANIIPHVLAHPDVVSKLIWKEVEVDVNMTFEFDGDGRVSRFDTMVNFVEGLQPVLGNYQEVAFVLSGAYVTASGQLGKELIDPVAKQLAAEMIMAPPPSPTVHTAEPVHELESDRHALSFILS